MSLPEELLDQLLTGYLDDALSADERDRVERLLQSNPEIADELAQLREMRETLIAVARADSSIKLEAGFADRVLDAAVERARAEGLAEDHPLIRLAEQPSTQPATTIQHSSWRYAGALVALAASIAIAVIALRPDPRRPDGLAGGPNTQPVVPVPTIRETGVPDPDEVPVPEVAEDPGVTGPEMIAAAKSDVVPTESPESVAVEQTPDPTPSIAVESVVQSPVMDAKVREPSSIKLPDLQSPIGAILVLDVQQTERGRQSNAVREAMKQAEIALPSKVQITDEVAGFVKEQSEAATNDVSVLYLLVQGKNFERLYNLLWNDQNGIESVRMAISLDAPLMKAVSAVRPDPTMIRGNSTALELLSDSGVVSQFAHELGQLEFPPMGNREQLPASPVSLGDDIQAQVLILVR